MILSKQPLGRSNNDLYSDKYSSWFLVKSATLVVVGGGGLVAKSCSTLATHGLEPARLLCPWNSPGKNTWVGCHFFLQGIFPTQGLNPGLLHCRQIIYWLSYKRSQISICPIFETFLFFLLFPSLEFLYIYSFGTLFIILIFSMSVFNSQTFKLKKII